MLGSGDIAPMQMSDLNQVLLTLHFLGLAMGFSASIANLVMGGLIAMAAPTERAVLSRFPPAMSRVGRIGLTVLWVTGLTLVFTKWAGFGTLPWQFHLKVTVVVLLTITVGYAYRQERLIRQGDLAAARRIPIAGRIAMSLAVAAVVLAVVTFN